MNYIFDKEVLWMNLRMAVEASGKSQAQIAREADINYGSLNHWLTARKVPSLESVCRICGVLNIPIGSVLKGVLKEAKYAE